MAQKKISLFRWGYPTSINRFVVVPPTSFAVAAIFFLILGILISFNILSITVLIIIVTVF